MNQKPNGYGLMLFGGEERPFHIGTHQGDIFCRLRGLSLEEYGQLFSPESLSGGKLLGGDVADLIYSALRAGYEWDGLRPEFTPLHVRAWLDDAAAEEAIKPIQEMLNQTVRRAEQAAERAKNGPAPLRKSMGGKVKGKR